MPGAHESPEVVPPPAGTSPAPAFILIADDDAQLRQAMTHVLKRHGYVVEAVANGRAALEFLKHTRVSVVITDIFMPDLDGLELINALRKSVPRPHLIAMSGGLQALPPDALNIAQALGAERTLCKPFEPAQLVHCVRETLATYGTFKPATPPTGR